METFLFVLLLILKILGIIILFILGLLLLVLFMALFVPVRYGGNGSYDDKKTDFHGKVTYLLHILTVRFDLNEENSLKIKIFGITVNKKKNKKSKKESTDQTVNNNDSEADGAEPETKTDQPEEVIVIFDEDGNISEQELLNEPAQTENGHSEETSHFDGENECSQNKKDSPKNDKYDKIKEYLNILQSDEFKKSFELCKKQLGVVINAILPRKWKIEGSAGFDDPATTGKLCAVLGMISPWTCKHVFLTGDFESDEIHIMGDFKGRIYGITMLIVLVKVYFNKNIRRTIKMFKE